MVMPDHRCGAIRVFRAGSCPNRIWWWSSWRGFSAAFSLTRRASPDGPAERGGLDYFFIHISRSNHTRYIRFSRLCRWAYYGNLVDRVKGGTLRPGPNIAPSP